ncbi:type I polyketide synthase [Actinomadura rudentiformis]|uniref:type I polyketide synthase n=1 Tax=Actinomadura rudentiformis TaxID=359158 RepID=UPI001CEF64E2|nr:type I polyketide synthase [Actinomadura rudentiformis]
MEGVAVIGLSGRFPGARGIDEYWRNLCDGRDCLETLDEAVLRDEGVPESVLHNPAYVRRAGPLQGYDEFDADFFGFSDRVAELMDPQQRLFLQSCWHALEDAAYDPQRCEGSIGVFGTGSFGTYYPYNVLSHHDLHELIGAGTSAELMQGLTFSDPNFFTTRVAHALDLHGPAITVQTACSSGLVAVHLACQSLLCGEADMALAGAMTVRIPARAGYMADADTTISPDGYCRPFDVQGNGTVFTSGGGVVVLKRLADAIADRDHIRAVIRGSAVNNDGSLKMGYAAPSVEMQAAVIAEALAVADVDPATVGYVEAHGTGTALGDPVEVAALNSGFGERAAAARCAIGSVKGNIGHCEVAAGIAGLVKAVLSLEHRTLVPTVHFTEPNPELHLADTPFHVQDRLASWESEAPRRAGLSSLGVGGTNVHVVLEEAEPKRGGSAPSRDKVLLVSGRTPAELSEVCEDLAGHLRGRPDTDLENVAFTLAEGRRHFSTRTAVVASTAEGAAEALVDHEPFEASMKIVLLFPGTAGSRMQAAADLYRAEPAFAEPFDRCAEAVREHLAVDLRSMPAGGNETEDDFADAASFAIEYAMGRALESYGMQASVVAGTGAGLLAAACFAEAIDLAGAVRMIDAGLETADMEAVSGRVPLLPAKDIKPDGAEGERLVVAAAPGTAEPSGFLSTLGRLWSAGASIQWGFTDEETTARRTPLPGYPFRRNRHWVDSAYATNTPTPGPGEATPSAESTEDLLIALLSRALRVERIGVDDNFFELGGDSVMAAQIVARARSQGIHLAPKDLQRNPTVAKLARVVERTSASGGPVKRRHDSVTSAEPKEWVPLTPTQLQVMGADAAHEEMMIFDLGSEIDPALLGRAVAHVRRHHEALTMDFEKRGGVWEQHVADEHELPVMTPDELTELSRRREDRRPSLLAAVLEHPDGQGRQLAVVPHPAAFDPAARRLLAEDLSTACRQLLTEQDVDLPSVGMPWPAWAEHVVSLAHDPEVMREREHWTALLADANAGPLQPGSPARPNGHRRGDDIRCLSHVSDQAVTAAVRAAARSSQQTVRGIVLSALAMAQARVTGRPTALLDVAMNIRKETPGGMDLSRTVGNLTTVFPVAIPAQGEPATVLGLAEEILGAVPGHGLGYGVLRYLHGPTAEVMRELPAPDVVFSDCGAVSSGADLTDGPLTVRRSAGAPVGGPPLAFGHAVDVRCYRKRRRLHIDWWFDGARVPEEVMTRMRDHTVQALSLLDPSDDSRSADVRAATDR